VVACPSLLAAPPIAACHAAATRVTWGACYGEHSAADGAPSCQSLTACSVYLQRVTFGNVAVLFCSTPVTSGDHGHMYMWMRPCCSLLRQLMEASPPSNMAAARCEPGVGGACPSKRRKMQHGRPGQHRGLALRTGAGHHAPPPEGGAESALAGGTAAGPPPPPAGCPPTTGASTPSVALLAAHQQQVPPALHTSHCPAGLGCYDPPPQQRNRPSPPLAPDRVLGSGSGDAASGPAAATRCITRKICGNLSLYGTNPPCIIQGPSAHLVGAHLVG
jgi:hypothetical protein